MAGLLNGSYRQISHSRLGIRTLRNVTKDMQLYPGSVFLPTRRQHTTVRTYQDTITLQIS